MQNKTVRKPEIIQAEQEILEHMEAIRDIMFSLDTADPYLSLSISETGRIMFNNTYWELPPAEGIKYGSPFDDEEDYDDD